MTHPMLTLSEDVAAALADGQPLVALESTIISHGMPYPQNVETALEVEKTVRKNRALPATIASASLPLFPAACLTTLKSYIRGLPRPGAG